MLGKFNIVEEINDDNLYLRKISKDDILFYYNSLKIPELTKYQPMQPLTSIEHSKRLIKSYLKKWDELSQFNYIIEERNEKVNKLGALSLWNINWFHRRLEIGIWLLPKYWNRGYGKRAINLVKIIVFEFLNFNRIEAHISVKNVNSLNLFKTCGFTEEGRLFQYLNLNGEYHDAVVLSFLKKDF